MEPTKPHVAFLGDGEHAFRLDFPMIVELERVTSIGIGSLYKRVVAGDFRITDLVATIRLALIGGGSTPKDAHMLVARWVEARPIAETLPLALDVLTHAYFGPQVDEAETPTQEPTA